MHEFLSRELNGREAAGFGDELPHTLPELDIVSGTLSTAADEATGHVPIVAGENRRGVPEPDAFRAEQPAADHREVSPEADAEADKRLEVADQPREEQPVVLDIASFADEEPTPEDVVQIAGRHRDTILHTLDRYSDFVDIDPDCSQLTLEHVSPKRQTIVTIQPQEGESHVDQISLERHDPTTGTTEKHVYYNDGDTIRHAVDDGPGSPIGPRHMAYLQGIVGRAVPRTTPYTAIEDSIRDTLTGAEIPGREDSHQGAKELTGFLRSYLGLVIPERALKIESITADNGTTLDVRAGSQDAETSVVRIEANHPLEDNEGVWEQGGNTDPLLRENRYNVKIVTTFHADERGLTVARTVSLHDGEGATPLHDRREFTGGTATARMVRNFLRRPIIQDNALLPKHDS